MGTSGGAPAAHQQQALPGQPRTVVVEAQRPLCCGSSCQGYCILKALHLCQCNSLTLHLPPSALFSYALDSFSQSPPGTDAMYPQQSPSSLPQLINLGYSPQRVNLHDLPCPVGTSHNPVPLHRAPTLLEHLPTSLGSPVQRWVYWHPPNVGSVCSGPEDMAHNPGMCPDWESNQRPFGSQATTQSTEPHQPGLL